MDLIPQGLGLIQDPKHTTWIAPLLLLADTALSLLVVWKIPCTQTSIHINHRSPHTNPKHRHRNRLESLQPTNRSLPLRRTRLHQNPRRHGSSSLPSRARLHLPPPSPPHRLRHQNPPRPVHLHRSLPRHACPGPHYLPAGKSAAMGPADACAE